jgi:hypothetical protein
MQMNGFSLLILTSLPLVKGEREMLGQTPTKIHGRSVAVQSRLRGQTLLVGFEWTSVLGAWPVSKPATSASLKR